MSPVAGWWGVAIGYGPPRSRPPVPTLPLPAAGAVPGFVHAARIAAALGSATAAPREFRMNWRRLRPWRRSRGCGMTFDSPSGAGWRRVRLTAEFVRPYKYPE